MVSHSVPQSGVAGLTSQVRRRWQQVFRERQAGVPLLEWRCVSIDIGKYEHVAVMFDGEGRLLAAPWRFTIREEDYEALFGWVDRLVGDVRGKPVFGMEPTGHYYEQLAYEISGRYGGEQVYLIQAIDVARRREDWNRGTFKNDEVDACIINELLREGKGRLYQPPEGAYLSLYHLERCRLNREQASTRYKNAIVGHVDRLYPGLVINHPKLAEQYQPLFRSLWNTDTPRRLLELCPNPFQLHQHTPESLFALFRENQYWMTRTYAGKIVNAVQALCLPEPQMAAARLGYLARDLAGLGYVEQQLAEVEATMVDRLDETWGRFLRPTGVDPLRLVCLVATIGDMGQYASARQLFGRSGLYPGCHDSGIRQRRGRGERIVKPGDRHLRRQLMRFTISMIARYPALRRYKETLHSRGKGKVTTLIAVARKLSGIIYALGSQERLFDPDRLA